MPATDKFTTNASGMTSPLTRSEAVTPHDTTEQNFVSRAVWVGVAGNVTFLMADGSVAAFANVPAGTLLPVRAKRVNSTGTSATNILFLD